MDAQNASEVVVSVVRHAFDVANLKNYTALMDELEEPPVWQTWLFGLLIVSGCSFSAPLGMLIVPLLSKSLYERCMTLLIALGIGALSGSTLFVMVPQAFNLAELGDQTDYKVKCWIIIGALYGFFSVDRILMYILEFRRRRSSKKKIHSSTLNGIMKGVNGRNATETTDISGEKSETNSCRREEELKERDDLKNELEIAMINNNFTRTFSTRRRMAVLRASDRLDKLEVKDSEGNGKAECYDNAFLSSVNAHLTELNQRSLPPMKFGHTTVEMPPVVYVNGQRKSEDASISLDIQVVEKKVVDTSKIEVASVAYMIIFGSSANNFVDGVSMGAAFSDSILRGMSIGVAVVSQQFPQELGTLAILISSGLGLRRALYLNMIPIVLSYIGFAAGVMLDEINEGYDDYIFAVSSGMYLYIFLGTLIPEIRESTNELIKENLRESFLVTLLQFSGIAFGLALMYCMGEVNDAGSG